MANRVPLIVANDKIREIASGDTLYLSGNGLIVGGDLVPTTDSTYDLGSPTKKWKELYLSGNTIFLGNVVIKDNAGTLSALDSANGNPVAFSLSANTTDNLSEGSSNLYFTNARADSRIDTKLAGNVTIGGNLTVSGTETIINSTTLSVNDKTIVLADSAVDSSAANGAGIEVFAAGAKLTYNHANTRWDLNRILNVDAGGIEVRTNTGSVAFMDLYCESGNAHRTRLQAPAHSQYSGNVTVKVPAEDGTLATVGDDSDDTLLIKNASGTTIKTIKGVGNTAL